MGIAAGKENTDGEILLEERLDDLKKYQQRDEGLKGRNQATVIPLSLTSRFHPFIPFYVQGR